ncbi:(-)-endo-fenchol synthase, chloroplastic-like [Andrographis paniculata]|uniref:(-)-endo-fenchol synthase, chloroplastic-like n=1 Tax=Andrographis paniculata TaxID=175694 RepID=UPI0021E8A88E|nr:(-)-endo-fenchol synthase, chloroplastic-like [Andrographis paniculata]QJA18350.1 terpene synthase 35 [Andrographis paniculata]
MTMAAITLCPNFASPSPSPNIIIAKNLFNFKPPRLISTINNAFLKARCKATATDAQTRRSGNYEKSPWDFDSIHSLNSPYTEERYLARASELQLKVKQLLLDLEGSPKQLQLDFIDDLHRLGISSNFRDQIIDILTSLYHHKYVNNNNNINSDNDNDAKMDLYSTALEFRLLRLYGFSVPQEVFDCFKASDHVEFDPNLLGDHDDTHTKSLLQLYEASFLSKPGETTLDSAREFGNKFLQKKLVDGTINDQHLSEMVRRELELPLHWTIEKGYARWFIPAYETRADMNRDVHEFAALHYNIIQATYQQEFKDFSMWWRNLGFAEKLPFVRNRLVESFMWALLVVQPRDMGYTRILYAKAVICITSVDDIFDVYGSFDELKLFAEAFQRWDLDSINHLPDYMQIAYIAVNKLIIDTSYDILKKQRFNAIPYFRRVWSELVGAYLKEAEWYHSGHTPSMEDYINNGVTSSGAPLAMSHAYFPIMNPLDKETADAYFNYRDLVNRDLVNRCAVLVRIINDISTSPVEMERGDVPKSVECYMTEAGVSRKEAEEKIWQLIDEAWKELNQEAQDGDFYHPQHFIDAVLECVRATHFCYRFGDGLGGVAKSKIIKEMIADIFFNPIPCTHTGTSTSITCSN